jgi:hypothetical protein
VQLTSCWSLSPIAAAGPCFPSPVLQHASRWSPTALREHSGGPKAARRTLAQRESFQTEAQVVFRVFASLRWYRKFRNFLKEQVGGCEWLHRCARASSSLLRRRRLRRATVFAIFFTLDAPCCVTLFFPLHAVLQNS